MVLYLLSGVQVSPAAARASEQEGERFLHFRRSPFEVFEIELIFKPMSDRIQALGGTLIATLGLSSNYHELGILPIFRRVTPNVFKRSLESFTIDSEYGREKISEFCDENEQ